MSCSVIAQVLIPCCLDYQLNWLLYALEGWKNSFHLIQTYSEKSLFLPAICQVLQVTEPVTAELRDTGFELGPWCVPQGEE